MGQYEKKIKEERLGVEKPKRKIEEFSRVIYSELFTGSKNDII